MKFHSFCPRCATEFTTENQINCSGVCACGWIDDAPVVKAAHKSENTAIKAMAVFGVLFVLGFGHLESWGNRAFSIPFTKAAQLTGLLSSEGYRELAKTCIDLNKWSCAEDAYVELATDRGDVEGYALAGALDAKLNKNPRSLDLYKTYEKVGGGNAMSLLSYAKILEASGEDTEATRVYEKSIVASPASLPVQATNGLVRIMIKHGQYTEAYDRILAFHDSAENANGYLNVEQAQLEKQLGEKVIAQLQKKHNARAVVSR